MSGVLAFVLRISKVLNAIAGVAVALMMGLTVADVLGRAGGHPILGTFEIVSLLAVMVTACAIPLTSWNRRHVYMEFILEALSHKSRKVLNTATRLLCIFLFILMGVNLCQVAAEFSKAREVTTALDIPLYPAAYAAGICCFVEVVVFLCDIVKIWEEKYE